MEEIVFKKLFFGLLKSRDVAFKLSPEGIYYNSFFGDLGLIRWTEFERIEYDGESINMLLRDVSRIYEKLNTTRQRIVELYLGHKNAHFIIYPHHVAYGLKELFELIETYRNIQGNYN